MINERYILKNKLGEGRSKVYLCTDIDLNQKEFAIKILPNNKDPQEKKLFKDEFFSLKKLDHPLIVKPYDLGTIVKAVDEKEAEFLGSRYFTLEYFPGVELLQFPGIKNPDILKEIIYQICSVLYYLHQSSYIYYDLKPENILAGEIDGKLAIKLIDLGLASHIWSGLDKTIKGTAEFIAPEILKEESHDHRVDLYSLGILIYRIVYSRFPFAANNKLDVYKAHIEKEFEFPPSDYPGYFIKIMEKLLNKDPEKRYPSSLGVIKDLNSGIDNLSPQFAPAKSFAGRKDIINILASFIEDRENTELFIIKGSEGSGKTTLLNQLYSLNEQVIPVFKTSGKTGFDFIKLMLKDIVFNDQVYPQLPGELREKINNFLYSSRLGVIDEIKAIISQITLYSKFIILIDDFNKFDRFSWEIFREIIPILQVNYIKVIAAEDSEYESYSKSLHNTKELILNPFTEMQVNEFTEKSFAGFFPRAQLEKLILVYSDLLPGSIIRFIHDLLFLKIIKYDDGTPDINSDETPVIETILKSSQEEIYNIRFNSLTENETETAKYISAFNAPLEPYLLSKFLNIEQKEVLQILENLMYKNVIHLNKQSGIPIIISEGFKKYIYLTIFDKKEFHGRIASLLENITGKDINRNETARHYELSGNYSKCCSLLLAEAENAGKLSAFSYQKKIYHRLLRFPLEEKDLADIKYDLADVHYKLSEFQNCLGLVTELLQTKIMDEKKNELLILQGSCLVELGKYQEGKEILNFLIPKIKDKVQKLKLLTEIANAEFELGRYKEVKKICKKILMNNNTTIINRGKCFSLLGHTEIISGNQLNSVLKYFEEARENYLNAGLMFYSAGMEINIGNIYNLQGFDEKAKNYWISSLNTYHQIGNILREANILHNFGIYYYKILNFEEARENYQRAYKIFLTMNNVEYEISLLYNLTELYLITCNYQKATNSINTAQEKIATINKLYLELDLPFLCGRLNYILGNYNELKEIINNYNFYSTEKEINKSKKINYEFLFYLEKAVTDPSKNVLDYLKTIPTEFLNRKDEHNYIASTLIIISLFIELNYIDDALSELDNKELINMCKNKYLFEAEREYLIGRVAEMKPFNTLKPALFYFESAYNKIKDALVTELTWKVLFSLGMYYYKRGNRNKARDYFYYSKSVIINIADSISDGKIKETFLKKPERREALEIMLNELN